MRAVAHRPVAHGGRRVEGGQGLGDGAQGQDAGRHVGLPAAVVAHAVLVRGRADAAGDGC